VEGSIKLSGERKYGYGSDAMRAWAISKDGDTNFMALKEEFDKAGAEVKLFRQVIRVCLSHASKEKPNTPFRQLTPVDKFFCIRLYEFVAGLTDSYDSLDFQKAYSQCRQFVTVDTSQFYLEFAKMRLVTRADTQEYHSAS